MLIDEEACSLFRDGNHKVQLIRDVNYTVEDNESMLPKLRPLFILEIWTVMTRIILENSSIMLDLQLLIFIITLPKVAKQ